MSLIKKIFKSSVKNFLIGGIAIMVLGGVLEFTDFGISYSSYLYSALPVVYFYLFIKTYSLYGDKGLNNLNVHLIICSLIFVLFILSIYLFHKLKIDYVKSLILGIIVFFVISFFYCKFFMFKKFN